MVLITGYFAVLCCLLILVPLTGALLWDINTLTYYFTFPPRPGEAPQGFSWPVFLVLATGVLTFIMPFVLQAVKTVRADAGKRDEKKVRPGRRLPWWGYAGILLVGVSWIGAWTRLPFLSSVQPYTFPLLWVGYIIVVNGLSVKRTGVCTASERPLFFLALFPVSAVFWWFFEYLNRFVHNWYYTNLEVFSPAGYVIYATLCFSVVLPAVLSTERYLSSFTWFKRAYGAFIRIAPRWPKRIATTVLVTASAGLFFIGIVPQWLFPLVWLAPLGILLAMETLSGREHSLSSVTRGDWSRIVTAALAALICGFFWELWNIYSFAKWEYSIPFVQRFHLFEMPVLGYAGYLPFGLECLAVCDILRRVRSKGL